MGLNRIQPAVAAKPAKSQKSAKVEPILPETVTLSEQLEEFDIHPDLKVRGFPNLTI
jgi:hypothetical protein